MPSTNFVVESEPSKTIRARQLESIFDMPSQKKIKHEWSICLPYEEKDWSVGLIVGPSGSGKSQIGKQLFGEKINDKMIFNGKSVIDDFKSEHSIENIASVCQSVGFNTIPSWLKPYNVLSNGEKFRVEIARKLIDDDFIVVDEFTSVVDRQVACIVSNSVQKYARKNNKKFIAITCHYDIINWLNPDWVFDTMTNNFSWRLLQPRPKLECSISPVPYSTWKTFAPFHYMSADLNKAARCFGLFVENTLAAFAGVLHFPISAKGKHIELKCISRLVTLPDYQGLGLSFVLTEAIGSIYMALNTRLRMYPAHPALIRNYDKSKKWTCITKPEHSKNNKKNRNAKFSIKGGRCGAVFQYVGEKVTKEDADKILSYWNQNNKTIHKTQKDVYYD